jgi:hypothetical protein
VHSAKGVEKVENFTSTERVAVGFVRDFVREVIDNAATALSLLDELMEGGENNESGSTSEG